MARPKGANVQELAEIAAYHEDAVRALARYFKNWETIDSIRYLGMTRSEIDQIAQSRLRETELRSILQVFASMEAVFQVDFESRCKHKAKDSLSRAFRATNLQKTKRVRLNEDILELWAGHHPELKKVVRELRAALKLRHWLAHGRYWRPDNWAAYSYPQIEALATAVLNSFPLSTD